jgi:hypothetical protein
MIKLFFVEECMTEKHTLTSELHRNFISVQKRTVRPILAEN